MGLQVLTCFISAVTAVGADDFVQLDANNMMAGQTLMFELELVGIEPQK